MIKFISDYIHKNTYIKSVFIYFIGTILLQGISIVTIPIFTRLLSTEEYAITILFRTWVSFFGVFIGLQVGGSIASARVNKEENEFKTYMSNIVILSIIGAIVVSLITYVFQSEISRLLSIDKMLISHVLLQAFGTSCAALFTTYTIQTKMPKTNIIFSIIVAISTVTLSLLLIYHMDTNKYLGKIYAGSLVNLFIIIYVIFYFLKVYSRHNILSDWKFSLILGTPLIIHLLANIVIGQSDKIFLERMINLDAAGIYSVAYSIGTLALIFAEVTNKVWSPWYLDNTKMSNTKLINNSALKYSFFISFVFVAVIFVSPEIIKIMAPKEYWSGIPSLIILALSVYFQFLYRFP
ncbi:MAG: oligosaccharide flippase family protein, partial [Acholeplasma sp.]|nr:oligosaccharide flippase family protein [Acholeplasma sp.]